METVSIPTSRIYSRQNHRQAFHDIEGLADDILQNGLINPITVEPADNGQFALIAGERRYRAFCHANIAEIPAIIRQGLSRVVSMLITLGENDNRAQTNVIEQGEGYSHALDIGATIQEIARSTNKRADYIERRVALLALRPNIQKLLADGQLSIAYGSAMVDLDPDRQMIAIVALRDNDTPTIKWFQMVVGRLLEEQQQQVFDFGLFGDGSDMIVSEDLAMAQPDNPSTYKPVFDPYALQSDIQGKVDHWTKQGELWLEIGKQGKQGECLAIVNTLIALLDVLPVALDRSPEDKIARLIAGSPEGLTTRSIYQYGNLDRSQWLPIKSDLLSTGRIMEVKSGRGFRYYAK